MTWRQVWATAWGKILIILGALYGAIALAAIVAIALMGPSESRAKMEILASGPLVDATLSNVRRIDEPRGADTYLVDLAWTDGNGATQTRSGTAVSGAYYFRLTRDGVQTVETSKVRIGEIAGRPVAVLADDPRGLWHEITNEQLPFAMVMLFVGLAVGSVLAVVVVKAGVGPASQTR